MGKQRPRVLIIEDHAATRRALAAALRGEGYEVRVEADGSRVDAVLVEFRPDLAILDVRLPFGPDGFEIGRKVRDTTDVPMLFLTAADSLSERHEGFDVGADDYVLKPFDVGELLRRVRALLRRSGRLARPVRKVGDLLIDEDTKTVERAGNPVALTATEFELLSALARHPGHVLSKVQLLARVWGSEARDVNVVEAHVSSLRHKLEAFGPRILITVYGTGYALKP